MKILNNCIVSKCSDCERYCFPTHIEGIWSDTCLHRDFPRPIKPVNPDSIDKDCPLVEVDVIEVQGYARIEYAEEGETPNEWESGKYNIDKIIIVKKPIKEGV